MGQIYTIVGSTEDLATLDRLIIQHAGDKTSPFAYLTVKDIPTKESAPEQRRFSLNFDHRYQPVNALWDIIEPACPSLIAFAWLWDEVTMQDEESHYIYFTMGGTTQTGISGRKLTFAMDPRMLAVLSHKNKNWLGIKSFRHLRAGSQRIRTIAQRARYILSGQKSRDDARYRADIAKNAPF
jgi:hypothetical protein